MIAFRLSLRMLRSGRFPLHNSKRLLMVPMMTESLGQRCGFLEKQAVFFSEIDCFYFTRSG